METETTIQGDAAYCLRKSAAAKAIHLKRSNPAEVLRTNMALEDGRGRWRRNGKGNKGQRETNLELELFPPSRSRGLIYSHGLLKDETDDDGVPERERNEERGSASAKERGRKGWFEELTISPVSCFESRGSRCIGI